MRSLLSDSLVWTPSVDSFFISRLRTLSLLVYYFIFHITLVISVGKFDGFIEIEQTIFLIHKRWVVGTVTF